MMVVLHRAAIAFMVAFVGKLTFVMVLAAGFHHIATFGGGAAGHSERAGVQARENAENQQCCEKKPHPLPQTRWHPVGFQGKIREALPDGYLHSYVLPLVPEGSSFPAG
jgi:hypothetical protein